MTYPSSVRTKERNRGFALLIAVIFMSVMLAIGLGLGAMSYKQEVLASSAVESQYAFYTADAALECALYADQQLDLFAYPQTPPSSAPTMSCDGSGPYATPTFDYNNVIKKEFIVETRLSFDGGTHCADVTVYKPSSASNPTYIFSQGYNVSCAVVTSPPPGTRIVSRGLSASY